MDVQTIIENKITANIPVDFFYIENESFRHAVAADSQSHFKVTLVSPSFENMPLIARHRLINELLKEQLAGEVHALALHTYTPAQWQQRDRKIPDSTHCLGG